MVETLSTDDGKRLLELCRAGQLYAIEKWISSGMSLRTPSNLRKTPLSVALDIGFHSLVELLVRHEDDQARKNHALSKAVSCRRIDLVELLISYGAEVRSVPLVDVLLTWEPRLIQLFLDSGADVVTGAPFTVAFSEKIRTALRPFVEYKKRHPDLAPALQKQADRALRHFSYEGDLKWISLLLWAGADPRSLGPALDDRWADDPDCHTTALKEACSKGNLEVLRKLKPNPELDDFGDLLSDAAHSNSKEMLEYLLKLGARPNNEESGGCTALSRCFWNLGFETYRQTQSGRPKSRWEVQSTIECLRVLMEHGAEWKPRDKRDLNALREALCKCEPQVTVDLVKLFVQHGTCTESTLADLLETPRMRQHLSPLVMRSNQPGRHY